MLRRFEANPAATVTQQRKGPAPFCRLLTTADGSIVADHAMAAPGIPGIEVVQELEGLSFPQPKSHSTSTRKIRAKNREQTTQNFIPIYFIIIFILTIPFLWSQDVIFHPKAMFFWGCILKTKKMDTNIIHAGEHVATCPSSHRRWWQH